MCRVIINLVNILLLISFQLLITMSVHAELPVKLIRFDDIKPTGAKLTSTFNALGFDPQERLYVTLCNGSATNGDCYLFRWDRDSGEREYLGSLSEAARAVGNLGPNKYWPKKEVIIKGHTRNVYLDGRMWLGTMNVHGYENPKDHRGIHIFAYDIENKTLIDHSQWQPMGVFKKHSGMYALDAYSTRNLLIGIGPADCEIIIYNPGTRETLKIAGVPKENNPQLSGRGMAVVGGRVFYQCGSPKTPIGVYDIDTGKSKSIAFPGSESISLGYVPTIDGKKVYISDQKTIFELDVEKETFRELTTFDPEGVSRQVSPPALSIDEKRIYYVINMVSMGESEYINDLYEFDIELNVRTKIMNLKNVLDGGAKVSGTRATASDDKIYFLFNGERVGLLEIDVSSRAAR